MVIDSNYKFDIDDFNIYIVFELNKLILGAAFFLMHNLFNGYSGNSGLGINLNYENLFTYLGYTNSVIFFLMYFIKILIYNRLIKIIY